jgi:RHS repeat-associated protein
MKKAINKLLLLFLTLLLGVHSAQALETVTYYHHDALGSPVAVTDESGNLLWREDYMPYGERVRNPANASDNTLWYTSKPEEPALGLQYFGARWYDPSLGRFTGMDPVKFSQGNIHSFNRYAYANNNPYKFIDPDGRSALLHTYKNQSLNDAVRMGAPGNRALEVGLNSAGTGLATIVAVRAGGAGLAYVGAICGASPLCVAAMEAFAIANMADGEDGPPSGKVAASFTLRQLEKKFKHASDFGITTTKRNRETFAQFELKINNHLSDPNTIHKGTYGWVDDSKVFYNSKTNNAVVLDKSDNFVTGFKLAPGTKQYEKYMKDGHLQ